MPMSTKYLHIASRIRTQSPERILSFDFGAWSFELCFQFVQAAGFSGFEGDNLTAPSRLNTMAAVPLLKNESVSTDESYDDETAPKSEAWRKQLLARNRYSRRNVICLCLLSFATGIVVAASAALLFSARWGTCFDQTSMPSPLTRDLDITYHIQQFNGSLMKENVYRQPGSPEVDAAWEALGVNCMVQNKTLLVFVANFDTDRPLSVPPEIAGQVGLAPDQVKVNSKYGGGFPANVESLHQLHCAVRQRVILDPLSKLAR